MSPSTPSIYRAPFLGYFFNSSPISAKSSVDNSTSPALRFSKVRFMFLQGTNGVNDEQERQETQGRYRGRSYTHEDPGSGMMWLPRAPTQAILSWATVMPLRFAIVDRVSEGWSAGLGWCVSMRQVLECGGHLDHARNGFWNDQ